MSIDAVPNTVVYPSHHRILATLAKDHDAANEINSLGGPSVLQRLISANTPISTNRFPNKLIAADAVNANSSWVCRRDTSWADSEVSFPRDDFSNVAACNELFGEQWDPTNEQASRHEDYHPRPLHVTSVATALAYCLACEEHIQGCTQLIIDVTICC